MISQYLLHDFSEILSGMQDLFAPDELDSILFN